jgi:succinate-semialdehyde dehydrogenase/glutarate-semialdehyde dehydrogenase
MGKPIKESKAEIMKCAWVCRYYAENAKKHLAPEIIESDAHKSLVSYEPIGTILGIMPWNFPFWQVFRFLAPTLMAGNTAILKHASNVQGCAKCIEEVFNNAGYPKGVFQNMVIGSGRVKQLIKHDTIMAVTLTGSEYAGSQVAGEAGLNIKKTVLELGGSNAFVVLNDANIDAAVDEAIKARMMNGGQSCIAAKRFILLEQIADEFIEKYTKRVQELKIGDPMDENIDLGPLSSVKQAEEVERQVNDAVNLGAKILTGGKRKDAFYYPTVLDQVTSEMPTFREEVFGPVASMIRAKNIDMAIDLVNASRFGLGATIYTEDYETAEKLVPRIEDGAVFINSLVKSDPRLPFGGTKKSGYGRELSLHGIREFVNIKTVYFA